jgi:hypothetical protein
MNILNDERQKNRYDKEDDNDPLQDFHPTRRYLIRNLLVNAFERFELSQNAAVPFCKVKALCGQTIQSREILVAQQL